MNIIIPSNKDGPLDLIVEYVCDTSEKGCLQDTYLQMRIRQIAEEQKGHIILFSQGNLKKVYALFDRIKENIRQLKSSPISDILRQNLNGSKNLFTQDVLDKANTENDLAKTFSDTCQFQAISADIIKLLLKNTRNNNLDQLSDLLKVAIEQWNAAAVDVILNLYPSEERKKQAELFVGLLFTPGAQDKVKHLCDQMYIKVFKKMLLTLAKHGLNLNGVYTSAIHNVTFFEMLPISGTFLSHILVTDLFYFRETSPIQGRTSLLIQWAMDNHSYSREEVIRIAVAYHRLNEKNEDRRRDARKPKIEIPILKPFLDAYLHWEKAIRDLYDQRGHIKYTLRDRDKLKENGSLFIQKFREVNQQDPDIAINLYFFFMEKCLFRLDQEVFCKCIPLCPRINLKTRGGSNYGPPTQILKKDDYADTWQALEQNGEEVAAQGWKNTLDKLLLPDS